MHGARLSLHDDKKFPGSQQNHPPKTSIPARKIAVKGLLSEAGQGSALSVCHGDRVDLRAGFFLEAFEASGGVLELRRMATARRSRTAASIQSVLRVRLCILAVRNTVSLGWDASGFETTAIQRAERPAALTAAGHLVLLRVMAGATAMPVRGRQLPALFRNAQGEDLSAACHV